MPAWRGRIAQMLAHVIAADARTAGRHGWR
jgi:hypothetical protein